MSRGSQAVHRLAYFLRNRGAQGAEGRRRHVLPPRPYIAYDAIATFLTREYPSTSWLGVVLSVASLIIMPLLGVAKRRVGSRLGSAATAGGGTQNLLCAYFAAAVLVGLRANTFLGWWWLDPVVALASAALPSKKAARHGAARIATDANLDPSQLN